MEDSGFGSTGMSEATRGPVRWPGISRSMIGAFGIVKERLDPAGYIQIAGELWKAERIDTAEPIQKGERVRVVKMEGLKLFVTLKSPEDKS